MATYVLIHGGGHGGWCYQPMARWLRARGHEVHAPSLTGCGDRQHLFRHDVDLECHITDVASLLEFEDLHDVILVGHSYGGMVITGAADRVPHRIGHLVYLDAATPTNGQSLADVAGRAMFYARANSQTVDGVELVLFPTEETIPIYGVVDPDMVDWMRPRLTPHPWRCFEQPLQLANEDALGKIPQSHINSTRFLVSRDVERIRTITDGRVWDLDTGHDMMITEPQWVAEKLLLVASFAEGAAQR